MSHLVIQWCTTFLFSVLYKIPVFSVVQNSCFQWCTIFLYEMLYLSLFCLNLSYKSLDVYKSGGGVVPNSEVYKYSDPPVRCSLFRSSYLYSLYSLHKALARHALRRYLLQPWPALSKPAESGQVCSRQANNAIDGAIVHVWPVPKHNLCCVYEDR